MKSNVKFITSIFFLILLKFNAKSQTHNYQDQVVNKVNIVNTSSNPFDYDNWQLESSDEQKIIVSLIPSGIDELYMQQNNSSFILNVWNSAQIMFTLQVQWDNNGYVSLAIPNSGAISVNNILPPAAFRSIGDHNLKVKYTSQNGMIYNREFIVHVVPTASRFYKNNLNPSILTCGNTITLWENANNPNAIPILISEGFDAYNTTFAEFYAYAGKNLISELINNGYKVYILDYEYNTQSMKNSAAIFNSAVRFISSINGNINIIAGGISMGGVIARYSITKAENDKAALPVFKFISIDAPQQGAFVSPELQKVIDDHTDDSSFEAHGLNNDAAKQLLKINRYDHSGLHKSFYNELNNLNCGFGYPKLCETIGVSFSNPNITRSVNGTWLQINVLDYYFLSDNIVLTMPEKVPGSLLPKSSVGGTSGNFGFIKGAIEVERYLDPTYISHNSSLDKIGEDSKFNVTIISNGNNFHDVFPIEVISPLI